MFINQIIITLQNCIKFNDIQLYKVNLISFYLPLLCINTFGTYMYIIIVTHNNNTHVYYIIGITIKSDNIVIKKIIFKYVTPHWIIYIQYMAS